MSRRFFGSPSEKLTVVGITGTKGKTSVSFIVKGICEAAGVDVGIIGSNGVFYGNTHFKLPNTTPESYVLHKIMADMVDAGVRVVVLEATSQGFMMRRTDGLRFDIGVYTNISYDHVSRLEHSSFEEYFACKRLIFGQSDVCLVNRDAELFDRIVEGAGCEVVTYGFGDGSDYRGIDVSGNGGLTSRFACRAPGFRDEFALWLPGRFSVSNALAAIGIADRLGIGVEEIRTGLAAARIPGRTEIVDVPAPYQVMIDFAHNKLSMEALIDSVQAVRPGRILVVFGLEGDRARTRRFDCGDVLGRAVDYTILADASPRFDDPDQIIADIAAGIERSGGKGKYEVIRNRRQAIPAILGRAEPGDLVLLIGKGDVRYDEVMGHNDPLDEREIVRDYFAHTATGEPECLPQGVPIPENA